MFLAVYRLIARWLLFRRTFRNRIAVLEHRLALADERAAFLEEQLESYRDTCQAHQWYQRAAGAEAKAEAERLRAKQ